VPAQSIEVLQSAPADLGELETLLAAARAADDHQPLGEQKRLELQGKGPFLALLLRRDTGEGPRELVGLAQIDARPDAFGLEVVVHPAHRGEDAHGEGDVRRTLVTAARDEVARRGGGTLRYWVARATTDDDAAAQSIGFTNERSLLQLRIDLDAFSRRERQPPIDVRPFRTGRDEPVWLAVNERAFADHPEQGRWDAPALAARESESWFDPDGFLLTEEGGRLAGSCWTKLHFDTDPLVGEIYVISVDPDFQGKGLGRSLTAAGLDWLAGAGARVGMLYVDHANEGALAMYRSLGFHIDHADRCYVTHVPPA
jgi:mycothiol synthase